MRRWKKREAVSLVRGQVLALLPRLAVMEGVAGCALLATCNRTELYLHGADGRMPDPLETLADAIGFDAAAYRGFSVKRSGEDAVRHLMQVAAGLESQIFGDDQIVTQVKTRPRSRARPAARTRCWTRCSAAR